ncbi:MAG: hypothetical protein LBI42_15315 [Chitinispirillales bacterium]|jgi:hypothetical protein|nr:hypothetical protein [Chitinispirillales bacterium]
MDRYTLFLGYYRLLTDFIILHELLFAKNSNSLYPRLVHEHRVAIVNCRDFNDDVFEVHIKYKTSKLLAEYTKVIEHYFTNNCHPSFKRSLNVNASYNAIVSDIESALSRIEMSTAIHSDNILDVQKIVDNIHATERSMPYFATDDDN